jgi:hypothetical protein
MISIKNCWRFVSQRFKRKTSVLSATIYFDIFIRKFKIFYVVFQQEPPVILISRSGYWLPKLTTSKRMLIKIFYLWEELSRLNKTASNLLISQLYHDIWLYWWNWSLMRIWPIMTQLMRNKKDAFFNFFSSWNGIYLNNGSL